MNLADWDLRSAEGRREATHPHTGSHYHVLILDARNLLCDDVSSRKSHDGKPFRHVELTPKQ